MATNRNAQEGTIMANTTAPLHPNPKIAKALAAHAKDPDKFSSAAELCRSVGINDMPTQRAVRQIMRDAGQGVGRGRRYNNITTPKILKARAASQRREQAAAKATKAKPKAEKPAVKAEPVAAGTPEQGE